MKLERIEHFKLISEQQSNTTKWTWWIITEYEGKRYCDWTQEGSPDKSPEILLKMLDNIKKMINHKI